jgi:ethanolamine ammonia-lyase small subunit
MASLTLLTPQLRSSGVSSLHLAIVEQGGVTIRDETSEIQNASIATNII